MNEPSPNALRAARAPLLAVFVCAASAAALACGGNNIAPCVISSDGCRIDAGVVRPDAGAPDAGVVVSDGGPPFVPAAPTHPLQTPSARVSGLAAPSSLVIDGAFLYVTSDLEGTVHKVPREGGTPVLLAAAAAPAQALAIDGERVYWHAGVPPNSQLRSVSIHGGTVLNHGLCRPDYLIHRLVVFDATYVYWIDDGDAEGTGGIYRGRKTGGTPEPIVGSLANPRSLALDDTTIYWLQANRDDNGTLHAMPKEGGAVRDLGGAGVSPMDLVAAGDHLYWVARGAAGGVGSLRRVAKTGGHTITLAATSSLERFAYVDGYVYYATSDGRAFRVPADGSVAPIPIADSALRTVAVTGDRSDLFFVVGATSDAARDGKVVRITP